jgi:hypothetical protein
MNDLITPEALDLDPATAIGPLGPFDTEITGFAPVCGPVGTLVTIAVRNFGIVQAVSFNNEPATEFSGGVGAVVARVPRGATTGQIAVTDSGGKSAISRDSFSVTPESERVSVTGFSPTAAAAGGDVMVFGTNFGGAQQVLFGNERSNNFSIDNANQITAKVPSATASGPITVVTRCGGSATSAAIFTASAPPPVITDFNPKQGTTGDASVTLTGFNLGFAPKVRFFDGVLAMITDSTANSLTVTVPLGAKDGPITIETSGGKTATRDAFNVLYRPDIRNNNGFTPTMGAPGQEVILFARAGTLFPKTDVDHVSFKGPNTGQRIQAVFEVLRDPNTREENRIKTVVPMGAVTGPIRVVSKDRLPDGSALADNTGPFPADFVVLAGDPIRPTAASDLAAAVTPDRRIRLNWRDNSSNETGFRVQRTGDGNTAIFSVSANVTTLVDTTPVPGIRYCYRVIAFNSVGDSDASNEACATVAASADPVVTSITPSSGPVGTPVEIAGSNLDQVVQVLFNGIPTSVNIVSSTLIRGVVPPGASSGPITLVTSSGRQITGPLFTVSTLAAAPTNLQAIVIGNQIRVSWIDNSGNEAGFKLERRLGGGAYQPLATLAANVTTYFDPAVIPEQTYCYRVKAFNGSGESAFSNEGCVLFRPSGLPAITSIFPTSGAPGTPVTIRGSNLASEDLSVLFNVTEALSVQILSAGEVVATVPQGATTGRIRATTPLGTAMSSSDFVVGAGAGVPNAPSMLQASVASPSQVNLIWQQNSNDETGFVIERRLQPSGAYAQIGSVGADVTALSDTTVAAGNAYTYRVKAVNAIGPSSASNEVSVTVGSGTGFAPIVDDFNPKTGAPGTQVSIVGANFNSTAQVFFGGAAANRAVLSQTQINATLPSGATSGPITVTTSSGSASSNAIFIVSSGGGGGAGTAPAAPSNLVAEGGLASVTLRWTDNSTNEAGFKIERRSGGVFQEIASVSVSSFTDSPVSPSVTHTYRVRAFNSAGNSGYSNEVSARPLGFEF